MPDGAAIHCKRPKIGGHERTHGAAESHAAPRLVLLARWRGGWMGHCYIIDGDSPLLSQELPPSPETGAIVSYRFLACLPNRPSR
jgi:hypothetical protein